MGEGGQERGVCEGDFEGGGSVGGRAGVRLGGLVGDSGGGGAYGLSRRIGGSQWSEMEGGWG